MKTWGRRSREDTDDDGCGSCISCGKSLEIGTKDCQAGHYIPKGRGGSHYLGLPRFPNDELAERNVNLQCAACNLVEGGNFLNYEIGLRKKYGNAETDELKEAGAVNPIFKRLMHMPLSRLIKIRNLGKKTNKQVKKKILRLPKLFVHP